MIKIASNRKDAIPNIMYVNIRGWQMRLPYEGFQRFVYKWFNHGIRSAMSMSAYQKLNKINGFKMYTKDYIHNIKTL